MSDRTISSRSGMDPWFPGKEQVEEAPVDCRQPLEVVDRHSLVDLMQRVADEAELDDRADVFHEARVGRAAAGRISGRDAGDLGYGGRQRRQKLAGAGQERLGGERRTAELVGEPTASRVLRISSRSLSPKIAATSSWLILFSPNAMIWSSNDKASRRLPPA